MISPVRRSVNLFAPHAPWGKPRAQAAPAPAATAAAERAMRAPASARGPGRPPMPFSGLTTRARRPCVVWDSPYGKGNMRSPPEGMVQADAVKRVGGGGAGPGTLPRRCKLQGVSQSVTANFKI
jgi:hypothetical protein